MESTTYTINGKEFELQHHGVKGMKWGVRRYQNKDGTLTLAGKKRLAKEQYKSDRQANGQATMKRAAKGATAVTTALQVAGTVYALDMAYTGGAVTRATVKAGKAAVKNTLQNIGDQMFDYSILDKDGKVLRRYN